MRAPRSIAIPRGTRRGSSTYASPTRDGAVEVHDRVYGTHCFREPRLVSVLTRSEGFARLGAILQHGTPALVGWSAPVTRAEHSVGAAVLVARAGGGPDEQVR